MIKWLLLIEFVFGKIHHLELEEDTRLTIDLSSFVFNEQVRSTSESTERL